MTIIAVVLVLAPAGRAADPKEALDAASNGRVLDTHFGRYGYAPLKTLTLEGARLRVRLPAVKNVGQTGVYSYFALAGDFEVTMHYEWLAVPNPDAGYGVSLGLAVDTDGPGGSVALARTFQPKRRGGFAVVRGLTPPEGGQLKYETEIFPTQAKAGKLVLKREKKDLICLATDGPKDPLKEIGRVPFTDATIRKVRMYAEPGDAPNGIDARIGLFTAKAEEITGGIPDRDLPSDLWWWVGGTVAALGAVGGGVYWRRRQRGADD